MSGPDLSLKLLQALNDKDQKTVSECAKAKSVKAWIDRKVDVKQVKKSIFLFADYIKDITCLGFAGRFSNTRTVQQLVEAGADVNATDSSGRTPLHWACLSTIEVKQKVEHLLSCDASLIRARNNDNDTPLHRAALHGNDTAISVLIQHGAEVNERGDVGRTALHLACSEGKVACIHELMRLGADVEARDSEKESTPIHLAASFNHPDCVMVLLDKYSASINAVNKFGNTALHRAALKGNLEVVKLLTSYSQCDVNAKDNDGETATDLARDEHHNDIVDYLTSQSSFASVTSSLAASNITDDMKVYCKYVYKTCTKPSYNVD